LVLFAILPDFDKLIGMPGAFSLACHTVSFDSFHFAF